MEYPYDIVTEFSRNKNGDKKTFSVAANFLQEKEESPLKIFGPMSRLTASIIHNGNVASMNIHPSELATIRSITDYAVVKYYEYKYSANEDSSEKGPAFTTRFQLGSLKGKTPVDVLKEHGEAGKKLLNDQYTFLKSNLDKYPKNRDLMDAIAEAAKLDIVEIQSEPGSSNNSLFQILTISCRGNTRRPREDGKCPCYEGDIVLDMGRNLPVIINIKNYYAPIKINEDRTQNVILGQMDKDSIVNNSFSMTADCFIKCLKEMEDTVMLYKMLHAKEAFIMADKGFNENRTAALNKAS